MLVRDRHNEDVARSVKLHESHLLIRDHRVEDIANSVKFHESHLFFRMHTPHVLINIGDLLVAEIAVLIQFWDASSSSSEMIEDCLSSASKCSRT